MESFVNYNKKNFNANSLAQLTSQVIQFVVALDVSPSIRPFQDNMNTALRDVFMQELKNSHRKDDIVIKGITFNESVEHKSGFMPITSLADDYLEVEGTGHATALYDAVLESLNHVKEYRIDLEDQGIDVRTSITIITDGRDNASSPDAAGKIKSFVNDLRANEAWASSFTITMIGVGDEVYFKEACVDMGLDPAKCLVTIGATAKEIRQIMGVVSQSVSSSSNAGAAVSF